MRKVNQRFLTVTEFPKKNNRFKNKYLRAICVELSNEAKKFEKNFNTEAKNKQRKSINVDPLCQFFLFPQTGPRITCLSWRRTC